MVEWPQERRSKLETRIDIPQTLTDIPAALLREVTHTAAFASLVQRLTTAVVQESEPKTKVEELLQLIEQPDEFGDYDESAREAALALASVEAFRMRPTRETWEYLWSLAWHSGSLATFLPQAAIAAAADTVFREQFFAMARDMVERAAMNSGRRAIEREKTLGANLREHWRKQPQLSALWRGQFERSFHAVGRDDDHVLSIVAEIDLAEFVRLLATYDYPDPVAHALWQYGVSFRFERWKAIVAMAPPAFDDQSKWNGSLILPLLMATARGQFQFRLGNMPDQKVIAETTSDIQTLAAEVAKTLRNRTDFVGCATRWGNWLMRSTISAVSINEVPHPINAMSHGFIDSTLVDALVEALPLGAWKVNPPPDAEPWEPWCQLAVAPLVALHEKTPMPSVADFINEWRVTPSSWTTLAGRKLKQRAAPFEGAPPRADAYGSRLLALPMVEMAPADEEWAKCWSMTTTLREIVEFGDPDENADGGWQGRSEAARLLMLQFSIGLAMMDHVIAPQRELTYARQPALERLLQLLYEAVREMAAIDQLNGKFWVEAVRHLAVRRAMWLADKRATLTVFFDSETRPTLADFLHDLAGDTENLLALIYVAQQNSVGVPTLVEALKAADIDIDREISIAEHLRNLSPNAVGLGDEQLNAARRVATASSRYEALF